MLGNSFALEFKIVLLGDAAVGKTSLVTRFTSDTFTERVEATLGAAFTPHSCEVDGKPVKLSIWDTAGQERFASLASIYFRGAIGAIVVFDVCEPMSVERAKYWVKELRSSSADEDVVIILTANKIDSSNMRVDLVEVAAYAERNGLLFAKTSAKTGENVKELFRMLGQGIVRSKSQIPKQRVKGVTLGESTKTTYGYCCQQ